MCPETYFVDNELSGFLKLLIALRKLKGNLPHSPFPFPQHLSLDEGYRTVAEIELATFFARLKIV